MAGGFGTPISLLAEARDKVIRSWSSVIRQIASILIML